MSSQRTSPCDERDGVDDLGISGAAAEISRDGLADRVLIGAAARIEIGARRHQHPRRADAALRTPRDEEGVLQLIEAIVLRHRRCETLDSPDLRLGDLADRDEAGVDWSSIDEDRARPAFALAAPLLGSGASEVLAQDVEEAAHSGDVDLDRRAVDRQAVGRHEISPFAGADSAGRRPATSGRSAIAPRIRSGVAGRSLIQTPVASAMAATTAGAPTSIGSSPTPFAPCGAPLNGASTRIVEMRGASSAVGMMYVASRSFRYRPSRSLISSMVA